MGFMENHDSSSSKDYLNSDLDNHELSSPMVIWIFWVLRSRRQLLKRLKEDKGVPIGLPSDLLNLLHQNQRVATYISPW